MENAEIRRKLVFMRPAQVAEALGISKSTVYKQAVDGLLPKFIRIGRRATAWPATELAQVFEARASGASNDEIRALVGDLMAARGKMQSREDVNHA